jgi:hypothetical protein
MNKKHIIPLAFRVLRLPFVVAMMSFSTIGFVSAATVTWDADTVTTGAQDGDGTWTATSSNFWNGSADGNPTIGTDAINIGNTTGGYTVTIDAGGGTLDYANTTTYSNLTFQQSYTLAGKTAADKLSIGNITVNAGKTVTFSAQVVNNSAAVKTWTLNDGSTLNLSGGGALQNIAGASNANAAVNITAGTWTTYNNSTLLYSNGGTGSLTITQTGGAITTLKALSLGSAGTMSYTIDGAGASLTVGTGVSNLTVGSGNAAVGAVPTTTLSVVQGTLNVTGNMIAGGGGSNAGSSGTINISGGTVTAGLVILGLNPNANVILSDAVNISGGTTSVKGVALGNINTGWAAGSTVTLNVTGGTLYVGSSSIVTTSSTALTSAVNLSGGTIGASAAWTSTAAMNLGTTNGNITFKTANDVGTAYNITLSGVLSGNGGLTKTGAGTLTLSGANSFTGLTLVSAGTLSTGVTGNFGAGNIMVADASLTLGNSSSIGDTSTLTFSSLSKITLGTGVLETIGVLFDSTTNRYMTVGTWTANDLNSFFGGTEFFGTGQLNVTAVPEPATYALLAGGLGMMLLGISRRQRRRQGFPTAD